MTDEASETEADAVPKHAPKRRNLKAKAVYELRIFVILFLYLWVLFGVFVLNQSMVLREQGIDFTLQGFAFLNALVFAKVMMVFQMFDPGRWLRRRPLIYPILFETFLLTLSFLVIHMLEMMLEKLIHGNAPLSNHAHAGANGFLGLLSASIIMFAALLPFFGFRNLSLAMGEGRLQAMLFGVKQAKSGAAS